MTLQTVGKILIPTPRVIGTLSGQSYQGDLMDASGEKAAVMFRAPKTGNIRKIGFRTGTVTQCTNGLDIALQGVNAATGHPDGADFGGGAPKTALAVGSDTWYWAQLGTDAAVTINDDVAAVISFNSFAASDSLTLNLGVQRIASSSLFAYHALYTGSWADQNYPACIGIEYDDGSIEDVAGAVAWSVLTETIYNDSTDPDRRGNKFQVPCKVRAVGAWVYARLDQGSEILLYDADAASVLKTITLDKDIRGGATTGCAELYFASPQTLLINTNYRIVLHPTGGTGIRCYEFGVTDDGANKAMKAEPFGELWHLTTCNNAPANEASWANTVTSRMHIGLIIDQLDDGAGGGAYRRGANNLLRM